MTSHLPLLVDDGNGILQFDVIEETRQEDIGNANQTVVFLLVKERVCSAEIRAHHLNEEKRLSHNSAHTFMKLIIDCVLNSSYIINEDYCEDSHRKFVKLTHRVVLVMDVVVLPLLVELPHVNQTVLHLLQTPDLLPSTSTSNLNCWFTEYCIPLHTHTRMHACTHARTHTLCVGL